MSTDSASTTLFAVECPGMGRDPIDQLCIDTIRTLSIDAVQQANSGHPGTPMGLAPVAYTLWQRFLRFDPDDQQF
jgi:transketolase